MLFTFPHRHEFYSPKLKNISREHKCLLSVLFRDIIEELPEVLTTLIFDGLKPDEEAATNE
jgi:hypothetical protein